MSDETWQGLVDIDRLRGWMDGERLGRGPIEDPTSLTGDTQNVLLQFRRDSRSYVLRRSPLRRWCCESAGHQFQTADNRRGVGPDTELGTASEVWSRAISHTDECYSGWAVFKGS
jgi:hypothetical protein